MPTAQEATPGKQDLATFQTVVQQQEQIFGPLMSLSSSGDKNVMTFSIDTSPDARHQLLLATYTGHPPQKNGMALVCVGNCLVSSAPQSVAAYRPTP
jgi:hypothetical protein